MTLPVVQNVGTILRHHNDSLRRIVPKNKFEEDTIPEARNQGAQVVAALTALNAGRDPVAETAEVSPNKNFKLLSDEALVSAMNRLLAVTKQEADGDEPGQFDKIQDLIDRVDALKHAIAVAASRDP